MPQLSPDQNPLQRDGLSQPQRRLPALQPENTLIDERKPEDLLQFLAAYAKEARIRFFDSSNTPDNGEVWADLMNYERYFNLEDLPSRSDIEPHFALFLSFLHLFEKLQENQNTLTKKHLDFYYKEVLQLTNRKPVPDHVHVLFELAKNSTEQIIAAKTELDAGKDARKQPLIYQTAGNLTANRAKISHLRTVFRSGPNVYFAPVANTSDGVTEPLPPDNPTWSGFGPKIRSGDRITNLPEAQLGFAIASPILLLAEGEREITVILKTTPAGRATKPNLSLRFQLSGPKAWLEVSDVTTQITDGTITLVVTIPASVKESVVAYDASKLDGGYATNAPVLRCWLADDEDYSAWNGLQISSIQLDVKVTGLKKTLILENDLGSVSPEKPFMPFGASPAVGSALYVGSEEAVAKILTSVNVHFNNWVGLREDWTTYYEAYGSSYTNRNSYTVSQQILNGNLEGEESDNIGLFPVLENPQQPQTLALVPTVVASLNKNDKILAASRKVELVTSGSAQYVRESGKLVEPKATILTPPKAEVVTKTVSDSLLKISLDQDFGHAEYPQLLTLGVIDQAKNPAPATPKKIPNQPYAPLLKELRLDYTATTGEVALTNRQIDPFAKRPLQLFHLADFGQAEVHAFLNLNPDDLAVFLLPQFNLNGAFFLGLQDVGPQEAVAILFQVEEGSVNPENLIPTVEWSVLVQNQWRLLNREEIVSDTTNHLLTSGIIKFLIPKETSTDNSLFEPGHVWLRAELKYGSAPAPIDSVCNFVALHAQAVLANFTDQNNDPAHYNLPLAAETIRKSRQSLAAVKAIKQPYASFGGKPQESDESFYIRVSERLRHKQRAVSIWDYEHLVLQNFPTVYKVKCLNHTKLKTDGRTLQELAPGHVTIVVVPDLRNLKDVNRYEPQVDLDTMTQIVEFLNERSGQQVTVQVTNPSYERVKLRFQVKFRPNFEDAVYKKVLHRDLIAFLTPWAFDTKADIAFGGTIYKSTIINFIERRDYVEFVTNLTMFHFVGDRTSGEDNDIITASDARAVLASANEHEIEDLKPC